MKKAIKRQPAQNRIRQAGQLLRHGGIVVYPTDTAYAIGCVFQNRAGIAKIMKLKGRRDPRFTVIASSLHQTRRYFHLNSRQLRLAVKYWPGPLSIVISKTMAVRVPRNSLARSLARRAGQPLIATSLNVSGQAPVYAITDLAKQYPDLLSVLHSSSNIMVLDAGRLHHQPPSTVVEWRANRLIIHRQGNIHVV